MANNITKISYQPLILQGSGVEPTVPNPTSLLPGDVGWDDTTHILIGQTAYNITENRYYIRSLNGIEPLKNTMYYEHDQGVPSDTWTITHNLGFIPVIAVLNSSGITVEGQIEHVSVNEVVLTFRGGFSGKAYLA